MLITGPLWARKAWGVWWEWDVKLTLALIMWLTFVAYLLLRRYGGPGSEKLAAGVGLFGAANMPFVYYSVNWWRTIHPKTTRGADAAGRACAARSGSASLAFMLLMVLIVAARVRLERQRALARRAVSRVWRIDDDVDGAFRLARSRAAAGSCSLLGPAATASLARAAAAARPPAQDEFVPVDQLPPEESCRRRRC